MSYMHNKQRIKISLQKPCKNPLGGTDLSDPTSKLINSGLRECQESRQHCLEVAL